MAQVTRPLRSLRQQAAPGCARARCPLGTTLALTAALAAGCASVLDAPRLQYLCPHNLRFEARLYEDMALLEGIRGHAVLQRLPDDPAHATGPRYADSSVHASFGLGLDGRLARLEYTSIPEPVYCQRQPGTDDARAATVHAHPRPGPRPPPPFDPDAPVQTNIRTSDGDDDSPH